MKYLVIVLMLFSTLISPNAVSFDFETEELENISQYADYFTLSTETRFLGEVVCFDVREDGIVAVATINGEPLSITKRIYIFKNFNEFSHCLIFNENGGFVLEFRNDYLVVYAGRTPMAIVCDIYGTVNSVSKVVDFDNYYRYSMNHIERSTKEFEGRLFVKSRNTVTYSSVNAEDVLIYRREPKSTLHFWSAYLLATVAIFIIGWYVIKKNQKQRKR